MKRTGTVALVHYHLDWLSDTCDPAGETEDQLSELEEQGFRIVAVTATKYEESPVVIYTLSKSES
jgi:hypothetical protein